MLFVTGEYPPMVGGVGRFTAELARALQAQGARIAVLTDKQVTASTDSDAVRVLPQRGKWGWRILSDIPACARAVGAEWVHVQYQTAAYGMHPAINALPYFLRRHGLRAAWTYHDLRVPYLFPKAGARLRDWVTRKRCRCGRRRRWWLRTRATGNRCGSRRRRASFTAFRSAATSRAGSFRRRSGAGGGRMRGYVGEQLVLGYFGFLNASKGGLTLIESVAALAGEGWDVHLLMIGERVGASDETNFNYLQRVEASISEHGLDGRVQWTGHQSDAEVAADFNAIDVLVMPYEDGMSLRRSTLTAALANGCAIVTTHPQAPTPELAAESDLLLVPPRDAAATAAAVRRIAADPGLAADLRANARRAARQFSWDVIAARHLEMYNA